MGNTVSVFLPTEKDEDYILSFLDDVVICTANSPTFTLASAGKLSGKKYTIINRSVGTLTVAAISGQTVDDKSSTTLATNEVLEVRADGGTNWEALNTPRVIKLKGYAFTNLPSGTLGDLAYITDASSISYRGVASGGGSDTALVMYDGTNWIYH